MNTNSNHIERGSLETVYDDEIMYAGWNPAVEIMVQHQMFEQANKLATPLSCLAMVNAESIMQRLYVID
jgi:hypothetical protein